MVGTSREDLHRLASLLEGDGCFTFRKKGGRSAIRITINMKDKDVIEDVAKLWNGMVYTHFSNTQGIWVHETCISGAKAIEWMKLLYPFMFSRRKTRIEELICLWESLSTLIGETRTTCRKGHTLYRVGDKKCNICENIAARERRRLAKEKFNISKIA